MSISVRPLSYALGAEIQGVEFDQIRRAFLKRGILLFREPEDHP